jgi:hypothetical protein
MAIDAQFGLDEVYPATAEDLTLTVYVGGVAATISAAAYTIYDSGGNTKGTGSATIASNVLTVTVDATWFTVIEENARIEWAYTISGTAYKSNNLFDIVKTKLTNPVIDADLQKYHPKIQDDRWSEQTTFQPQIDKAFRKVKRDIKNRGNRPALIVDAEQIKELIILKSLEIVFCDFKTQPTDIWSEYCMKYAEEYNTEFSNTRFKYDETGDGVVDTERGFATTRFVK